MLPLDSLPAALSELLIFSRSPGQVFVILLSPAGSAQAVLNKLLLLFFFLPAPLQSPDGESAVFPQYGHNLFSLFFLNRQITAFA